MYYCSLYGNIYKQGLIRKYKIDQNLSVRLDKYLKIKFSALTQSFIEKNIRKKNILVNNSKKTSKYIIQLNDEIKILNFHKDKYKNKIIFKKNKQVSKKIIQNFKSCIIFQNDDFIIFNKWSSIATQGGSKINISIDDIIKFVSSDYRLVHRLDKDTSGLLIIAKNLKTAKIFGNLFKLGVIEKTYIALCEGKPKLMESNVNLDIKNKYNKIENTKTLYKVLETNNSVSLILYKPLTGKTHQLRIVSKKLGCPIIGDKKYNRFSKFQAEELKLNAFNLKFLYKDKIFEFSSKLPKNISIFMKKNKFKDLNKYNIFKL